MTQASPTRRRPPDALPLTLLTGFLGAGKTTLLNELVRSPALAGAVVIINEFGDVPIDHLLVEKGDDALLTLASGCICCSVRGDLVTTLEDLLRRRDNGRIAPFDRVVIETTGLADPAPVLNVVALHPYLMLRFRIDGVITVVDALHGLATLDAHPESVRQAAMADCLVLTKTDLAAPEAIAPLQARLAALNPLAEIVPAGSPGASAAALLSASLFRNAARLAASPAQDGHAHHAHAPHGHAGGQPHRHGPHDEGVASVALAAAQPVTPANAQLLLDLLRATHGPALLRVKGVLALTDDPDKPLLVQAVQHTLHPARRLPAWPDGERGSRLVVIGLHLDVTAIRKLWDALTGPPAIDRPDAAGLSAPLAPSGPGLF